MPRVFEIAPVVFLKVYVEFFGGGFDTLPCGVAFGIGNALNLVKARDGVADVRGIVDWFFFFLWKGEFAIG